MCVSRLASQYQKAVSEVNETYQFYVSMLEERRAEVSRELEQVNLEYFNLDQVDLEQKCLSSLLHLFRKSDKH